MNKIFSKSPSEILDFRSNVLRRKIEKAVSKLPDGSEEKEKILALLGISGRSLLLLASDLKARREISHQIAKLMAQVRADRPDVSFYLFTLIDDIGMVSDRHPAIDVKALQKKADRTLRSINFDAITVVECHPLANYPQGGNGRSLLFHVHAIGWTDEPLNVRKVERELEKGGTWRCALGAPPVKIQLIGPDDEDLETVARYIVKPPHAAKNRVPKKDNPDAFKLLDTIKGYRPELALRTMEVLSQIELLDLISSVGDGKTVRQGLRSGMNAWHRSRTLTELMLSGEFDAWHFWCKTRQEFGSKRYLPVRILSGGYRMRPVRAPVRKAPRLRRKIKLPPRYLKAGSRKKLKLPSNLMQFED